MRLVTDSDEGFSSSQQKSSQSKSSTATAPRPAGRESSTQKPRMSYGGSSPLVCVQSVPTDAKAALLALESSAHRRIERRGAPRMKYRSTAVYHVQASAGEGAPTQAVELPLYTRDVNPWAAGFVVGRHLPTGLRGTLEIMQPDGRTIKCDASVRRCREFIPGWFEAVVHFARSQPGFSGDEVRSGGMMRMSNN